MKKRVSQKNTIYNNNTNYFTCLFIALLLCLSPNPALSIKLESLASIRPIANEKPTTLLNQLRLLKISRKKSNSFIKKSQKTMAHSDENKKTSLTVHNSLAELRTVKVNTKKTLKQEDNRKNDSLAGEPKSNKTTDNNDNSTEYYFIWFDTQSETLSLQKTSFDTNFQANSKSSNPNSNEILASRAIYNKNTKENGWYKLNIQTFNDANGQVNSLLQCYSAGYIEGIATYKETYEYFNNIHVYFNSDEEIKEIYSVLSEIYHELTSKLDDQAFYDEVKQDPAKLRKWSYITCITAQFEGMVNGYSKALEDDSNLTEKGEKAKDNDKRKLTVIDFLFLNSEGNIDDLRYVSKANADSTANSEDFSTEENLKKVFKTADIKQIWKFLMGNSHCSVILKLLENTNNQEDFTRPLDIATGHATWSNYSELIRILKNYDFAFDSKTLDPKQKLLPEPKKITFSSYPGVVFSGDDFYVLDNKVALLQTTLSVLDTFKYKGLLDFKDYLPEFIRLMTTNYLSESGSSWISNYQDYNNHMYITQWVIIDYSNLKSLNESIAKAKSKEERNTLMENASNIIYVLDEVPKKINSKDITNEVFDNGFFGSFNMPYFEESYSILGYSKFNGLRSDNPEFNPRLVILNYLQGTINDISSFQKAISYNGYQLDNPDFPNDPSKTDASQGIMSRYDVMDNTNLFGGVDYKAINSVLVEKMAFIAKLGPVATKSIMPFEITDKTPQLEYMHGVPKRFDFKSIEFSFPYS